MPSYAAPLHDMRFVLDHVADLPALIGTGAFGDASPELVAAVLEEAGRFAAEVVAPLNQSGDVEGCTLENGVVRMPEGFAAAYRAFVEAGWNSIAFDPDFGGQGLPWTVATAVQEMWTAANMSFALCPLLTQGAVDALSTHGTDEQKRLYLPRLVAGAWTGTMNLTEPQAGSDVGALRTRAEPRPDGSYRLKGTKIFITYGEHDMAENIVHLVLARLPDAPPGTRGISLFLVPKRLVGPDGSLGAANDLRCVGIEHKLGIHASPTCTMAYGEEEGAIGYLVGAENRGMACMFTMMNNARLAVGVQGVAIAERAFQQALAYAGERRQGKAVVPSREGDEMVPIIRHPDVRRMLLTMRALAQGARAVCYLNAAAIDLAHIHPDAEGQAAARARADLLTPIAKAWSTDIGVEAASIGVQVHGGMGYIEETGAAQHLRDARILPIYEGTNGIQAIDLLTRKLPMNGGEVVRGLIQEMRETAEGLRGANAQALQDIGRALHPAIHALEQTSDWLRIHLEAAPEQALAGATPYLRLFGTVAGGWLLGKGVLDAAKRGNGAGGYAEAKLATAGFYAANILPAAQGLVAPVVQGADSTLAPSEDALALL
jgi:alkylation response protein AidB-like acyl-CoA dehydrogenase